MDTHSTKNEGFVEPSSKKRGHPSSPKKDGISTCNSFSVLEEGHSTKKQALVTSHTQLETPSSVSSNNDSRLKSNEGKTTAYQSVREQKIKLSREKNASQQPPYKGTAGKQSN